MKKRLVPIILLIFFLAVRADDCATGIISDTGIPYETVWYLGLDEVSAGCKVSDTAYGGTWLQYVEIPSVPFHIDHVCTSIALLYSSSCTSSDSSPVRVAARVFVFDANVTANSATSYPHPMTDPAFPLFATAPNNVTVYDSSRQPINATYQTIPVDFVVYSHRIFVGVEFTHCQCKVGIQGSTTDGRRNPSYYTGTSGVWGNMWPDGRSLVIRVSGAKVDPPPSVPLGWSCNSTKYGDGVCDCGCGAPDVDCTGGANASSARGCQAGDVCSPEGVCVYLGWTNCPTANYWDGVCDCSCGGVLDTDCLSTLKPTSCSGVMAECIALTDSCMDFWTCPSAGFGDNHTCNCGCGVADPDCRNGLLPNDCPGDFVCLQSKCAYPRAWTCTTAWYNAGDGCDCECGAWDPDCATDTNIFRCPLDGKTYSCNFTGHCIVAMCGNNFTDLALAEECDGGIGCSGCQCLGGFKKATPSSINCAAICGDRIVTVLEECDSSPFCNTTHCKCTAGHLLNKTIGLCSGCGNGVVEGNEQCDGGIGCTNLSCSCDTDYIPMAPVSASCKPEPRSNVAGIVAGAVGGLVLISTAAVIVFFVWRHKKRPPPIESISGQPVVLVPVPVESMDTMMTGPMTGPMMIVSQTGSGGGENNSLGGYVGYMGSPQGTPIVLPPPPLSGPGASYNSSNDVPPPPSGHAPIATGGELLFDRFGNPVGVLQ